MSVETEFVHKTEKLADIAKEAGWTTKIKPELNDDDVYVWTLYCIRKPEAIKVVYVGNAMQEATYVCGNKTLSPPHKGAVVKLLQGQPDLTNLDGKAVMAHRRLPFDPEDILPGRILDILLGKRITWLNSLSTELETERIEPHRNRGSKYYRIVRSARGQRYIEFTTDHGFKAVYLDAIVSAT